MWYFGSLTNLFSKVKLVDFAVKTRITLLFPTLSEMVHTELKKKQKTISENVSSVAVGTEII